MSTLWVNRIIAVAFYLIGVYICEKYKLCPWLCFTYAIFTLIGLSFVFEIIHRIMED